MVVFAAGAGGGGGGAFGAGAGTAGLALGLTVATGLALTLGAALAGDGVTSAELALRLRVLGLLGLGAGTEAGAATDEALALVAFVVRRERLVLSELTAAVGEATSGVDEGALGGAFLAAPALGDAVTMMREGFQNQ